MPKKVSRLVKSFRPDHYKLHLNISPGQKTYSGQVVITGAKVGRPSSRFTFHQNGLTVSEVSVVRLDKNGSHLVEINRIVAHKKAQEIRLHSSTILYPGNYIISLNFKGPIKESMDGLYLSSTKSGQPIILTQFESHFARKAFPCIDEPEAKAIYELMIKTDSKFNVISNTPSSSVVSEDDKSIHCFKPTPKMSSYLLALVIGELSSREVKSSHGIRLTAWATKDKIDQTDFALQFASKCLDYFEDYFQVKYPLDKCDLVAIPDFGAAAMENWGLITFAEKYMLVDGSQTPLELKQFVAIVVAHELAHQWFGNLVTMRWWNDLWLNEGFASWVESFAVDYLFPEWKAWNDFIARKKASAASHDSILATHQIAVPIASPDLIQSLFDRISYDKSPVIINMLHGYLGAEKFKSGISNYLKKHLYKNTESDDLWRSLEETTKVPVKNFMDSWINRPGYPVVEILEQSDGLYAKQSRFLTRPTLDLKHQSVWLIPLSRADGPTELLTKACQKLQVQQIALKYNIGESGFFHVLYPELHYEKLIDAVEKLKLDEIDRFGIINDAIMLNMAGQLPAKIICKLISSVSNDQSDIVWDKIAGVIGSFRQILSGDDEDKLRSFAASISSQQITRLGWIESSNDSHFDTLLRPVVAGLQCFGKSSSALKNSQKLFDSANSPSDISSNLRAVVITTAVRYGQKEAFYKVLEWHDSSSSAEDISICSSALCSSTDSELIKVALSMIRSDKVRLQDTITWMMNLLSNRSAKSACWEWIQNNWDWYENVQGDDLHYSAAPSYFARFFSTKEELKNYKLFFKPRLNLRIDRSYKQGVDHIKSKIEWSARDAQAISNWLNNTEEIS